MDAVKLDSKEVRDLTHEANLFSIITAVEHLERGYVNGRIDPQSYERECNILLAQFKTLQRALSSKYPDIREFIRENGMDCILAEDRLLGAGVPATKMYAAVEQKSGTNQASRAFEMSTNFITLLDTIRVGDRDVDVLFPQVKDVHNCLMKFDITDEFSGLDRLRGWMETMNSMNASDQITDAQSRQLSFDIEQCYHSFKEWLEKASK